MHAYCLFCETNRCKEIAMIVEKVFNYRCIFPRIMQRKWTKGTFVEVPHDMLPGYLFLYTEEEIVPHLNVSGIIRFLGLGELKNSDLAFAQMLLAQGGTIGAVRVRSEGNRYKLADPVWEDMQGVICKVDRGRKRCCVEFQFDQVKRTVWVGYDIVEDN